jgi:hypothetical protein
MNKVKQTTRDISSLSSDNNGGSTDYYKFAPEWKECGDIIEARGMNYNQGNIFKASFCFNIGRHKGTHAERELNKIIYFAQRELVRIKTQEKKEHKLMKMIKIALSKIIGRKRNKNSSK